MPNRLTTLTILKLKINRIESLIARIELLIFESVTLHLTDLKAAFTAMKSYLCKQANTNANNNKLVGRESNTA